MYHAVPAGPHAPLQGADAGYAVTEAALDSHLSRCAEQGMRAGSVQRHCDGSQRPGVGVLVTFDDGHATNGRAAELLLRHGGVADFFVNPGTVGRTGFLSWSELRAMAAAGMSIQSHGMLHHYLDQLTPDEVRSQLVDSRREIEDRLGCAVTLFAPPGGRQAPGMQAMARAAGYQRICSSQAGLWEPAQGGFEIPRLAVLAQTPEAQVLRWCRLDTAELARQRLRWRALRLAKGLLGNRAYDRLRGLLLQAVPARRT
jgi:peptidoglycan/xylan/chitin deacetylase (PgdA/CDA1 family)